MSAEMDRGKDTERGTTLIELLVALIVLATGVLAVAQLFPAGQGVQLRDRLRTEASQLSREKIEELQMLDIHDPNLSQGRHPAGGATEKLGNAAALQRYYDVDLMAAPLDNLRKVTVSVTWKSARACTMQAVTYLGR